MKSDDGQEIRPELRATRTLANELEQEVQPEHRVSPKRAEASRRNGSKSRGPSTAVGKKTVSRNALKLGIFSRELVIQDRDGKESQAEFNRLFAGLCESYGTEGIAEELCVEEIAVCYWLLRRAQRFENGKITRNLAARRHHIRYPDPLLKDLTQTPSDPELDSIVDDLALPSKGDTDKLVRYETRINKRLTRAIAELARLQKQRISGFRNAEQISQSDFAKQTQ